MHSLGLGWPRYPLKVGEEVYKDIYVVYVMTQYLYCLVGYDIKQNWNVELAQIFRQREYLATCQLAKLIIACC